MMRQATLDDLPALLALEALCFHQDRFSVRTFRHLLRKGHALTWVEAVQGEIRAYAIVLLRKTCAHARLYGFVVAPEHQGTGLAQTFLRQIEQALATVGYPRLTLEVREDNNRGIAFYQKAGYKVFGCYPHYYEDHMAALRMHKQLFPQFVEDGN